MRSDLGPAVANPPMPRSSVPHILLVNPWIHDFAAYDFWAAPLGLFTLGGILRDHGARVSFIDCWIDSTPCKQNHPFPASVAVAVPI